VVSNLFKSHTVSLSHAHTFSLSLLRITSYHNTQHQGVRVIWSQVMWNTMHHISHYLTSNHSHSLPRSRAHTFFLSVLHITSLQITHSPSLDLSHTHSLCLFFTSHDFKSLSPPLSFSRIHVLSVCPSHHCTSLHLAYHSTSHYFTSIPHCHTHTHTHTHCVYLWRLFIFRHPASCFIRMR